MQQLLRQRVPQPQLVAVEGRAGDKGLILRAVEPVAGEGVAHGRHVEAELVGAAGDGPKPQQGAAMGHGQDLVLRAGGQALRVDAALEQGPRLAADGQVDGALRGLGHAVADAAILPAEVVGVEDGHAPLVHVAVFGHRHHAGDAAIQPVHRVEGVAAQIVGHRPRHGDGLLRQGRRVDGDPGGLVEDQQILVLPQHVQGVVHGDDGVLRRRVGHVRRQHVARVGHGTDGDGAAVQQDGVLPPFEGLQQGGGQSQLLPQQVLDRLAGQRRGDGQRQDTHGHGLLFSENLWKYSIAHRDKI